MKHLILKTSRTGYSANQCGSTLTVEELIDYISQWDGDTPVFFSNDNGYTYGAIHFDDIDEEDDEDDE